jgi:hypothetical protein
MLIDFQYRGLEYYQVSFIYIYIYCIKSPELIWSRKQNTNRQRLEFGRVIKTRRTARLSYCLILCFK